MRTKKTKLEPSDATSSQSLPTLDAEVLKELDLKITEEIKKEIQKSRQQNKKSEDYENLQKIVTEYLKCFLIIGYDINGQQILIGHANNPQEYNSLVEHLRQTFIRTMNSNS